MTEKRPPEADVHFAKGKEEAQKANEQHDAEVAQKAAEKKAAEDKAAAEKANAQRATQQKVADQLEAERKVREQLDKERRVKESAELAARDPNTYEDPSYQQSEEARKQADIQRAGKNAPYTPQNPEEAVKEIKEPTYPISEQTKAEMEAGKKAVAAAASAEKEAKKAE